MFVRTTYDTDRVAIKLSTHGTYLTQLRRFGISNCYLVREADGLTLVDTSFRGSAKPIVQAAQQLGLPITRVALTHAHHDHAGALDALRSRLPGAEFAVGEREALLLAGDTGHLQGEPGGRLRGSLYEHAALKPDRLLGPGDRVGSLDVVPAEGHTPGQLAFIDTRDRSLIAGDAYLAVGEVFVTTEFRWKFPFPALSGTWHAPTALLTAERLCDIEPARLATGHGPVVEDPTAVMKAALTRARARRQWG